MRLLYNILGKTCNYCMFFYILKGVDKMAYTLDEFVKLNKGYKKSYDPTTKKATVTNTKNGKSINFTSGQGQQYGLGGIENDSNVISDMNKFTSHFNTPTTRASSYESPYSKDILDTLSAIQDSKFTYNPDEDEGLQAAQGQAMDAVSRAAARRGMLYSDSNKSQMGKSAMALIPQFEQQAYNKYSANLNNLYNQLSTLQGLENTAYNRHRDTISDFTDTMGQFSNDFQAQINVLENDGDTSNDWQIPYLNQARNEKIASMNAAAAEKEQQDFENNLKLQQVNYQTSKPYYKPTSGKEEKDTIDLKPFRSYIGNIYKSDESNPSSAIETYTRNLYKNGVDIEAVNQLRVENGLSAISEQVANLMNNQFLSLFGIPTILNPEASKANNEPQQPKEEPKEDVQAQVLNINDQLNGGDLTEAEAIELLKPLGFTIQNERIQPL